jgi:transposase
MLTQNSSFVSTEALMSCRDGRRICGALASTKQAASRGGLAVTRSTFEMLPGPLVPLPPASPELNAAENIWQYLRQAYLSNRVFNRRDWANRIHCHPRVGNHRSNNMKAGMTRSKNFSTSRSITHP